MRDGPFYAAVGRLSGWDSLGWLGHVALHLSRRFRERNFWITQAGVAAVTALHFGVEAALNAETYHGLHSIPVIFYMLPVAYASLKYRWEGGLCTGGWVLLLVTPSIVIWHQDRFMWIGELTRVTVVVVVGVLLIGRVEVEARLRHRAEAASDRLAASEAQFRTLFEAAGDAIVVFDPDGQITAANAAAAALIGAAGPDMLVHRSISTMVPTWTALLVPRHSERNGGVRPPARVVVRRADGRELVAEAVVAPLPSGSDRETFQAVFRDTTVQRTREEGLRSLVRQITRAQEEERRRIARELHDDTLQVLILLSRELTSVATAPGLPEAAGGHLRRLAALASQSSEGLRRFSRDLRPYVLDDLGLVPAIEWLTNDLARRTALQTHFETRGTLRRLDTHIELALFRIAQEALRNVEKHAHARRVEIDLSFADGTVELTITDDGIGFHTPETIEGLVSEGKLGLVGLSERASLIGGSLGVQSSPGQGTRIRVTIAL